MPSDSIARKLLIHASVARTIPGLGKKRSSPFKRIPGSIAAIGLLPLQTAAPRGNVLELPAHRPRNFVFTETSPHVRQRLIEDACTNLTLAWVSFTIAHLAGAIGSLFGTPLAGTALSIARHVVTSDAGLVVVWGVVITLFQQFFDQTPLVEAGSRNSSTSIKAIGSAALIVATGAYLSGVTVAPPAMFLLAAFLNLAFSSGGLAWTQRLKSRRNAGRNAKNVLIVGAGELGREIADYLSDNQQQRLFKGFLDEDRQSDPRVLGKIDELAEIARTEFVDEIIVALPRQEELARTAIIEAVSNHLDVRIATNLLEPFVAHGPEPVPIMPLHEEPIPKFGLIGKRLMDLVIAGLCLLLLAPLLILIAAIIRMDSPGSAIYRAPRAGKKGRRFLCCKFRTMHSGADAAKEILRACNERQGATFKIANDPRITRVGRFLRRYSLDEWPQLWNVLAGDMSLVGPRPHPLDDYRRYGLQHLRRLDVTPGMTGLWQVTARQDPSFYKNMELDLQYIDQWSLWLDCTILARTLPAVLAGTGE